MSFDKPTRNALASMVGDCRRLLTDDIRDQLQAVYGLQPDGTALPVSRLTYLDERGHEVTRALREWQEHLASTEAGTDTEKKKRAFDRLAHETAFTVLNQLAALRMCEERGHVIECVRRGMESDGFVLYERFSGGALGTRGETYQIFLERVFDELAVDLGALFDLRAPQSLVFPREPCLEKVLTLLNDPRLAHLWKEDETIGWVYQYFNSKEEREKMREESAAPRNSRELAVRNQFFTPRYVVEFLVDNTLGRIWYEMRKGETALKDLCRYLVRRPTEIFLKQCEEPPASGTQPSSQASENAPSCHPERSEGLALSEAKGSTSELLKQPVYIPHRPNKDPRDLKILDPACGSGHFLLYCFDLLETIYEEAWTDEQPVTSEATGKSLREDFPDLDSLKKALPELILRHNLHGIDIDLRACQIAALALWLRAQRTYQRLGLKGADRPKITRSNIVCAEPMPGEQAFLEQFAAGLEPKVIGQLVKTVFEKMKLAGEAGSLLKIEEEIVGAVAESKKQWLAGPKAEQGRLFADDKRPEQKELGLDFSGIADTTFWEKAEERIYAALQAYAEHAENGAGYQRRLFADDAARGFAFIDLCRNRYDVVLMNPPFGEAPESALPMLQRFGSFSDNIAAPFAERFLALSEFVGMVLDRALLIRKTHESFRRLFLAKGSNRLRGFANYGWGVLDAYVEVAGLVAAKGSTDVSYVLTRDGESEQLKWLLTDGFAALPNLVISGDVPDFVVNAFASNASLGESSNRARVGHQWKSERYLRLWWEGVNLGPYVYNGAPFSPYTFVTRNRMTCDPKAEEVQHESSTFLRNEGYHYLPGVAYGKRGIHLDAHFLPAGQTFTVEGLACIPSSESDRFTLLAYLNSLPVSALLSFFCGQHKHVGYVNCLPFSTRWQLTAPAMELLQVYTRDKRRILTTDETSPLFAADVNVTMLQRGVREGFEAFSTWLRGLNDEFNRLHLLVSEEVAGWLRFPQGWESAPGLKDAVETFPVYDPADIFDESDFHSSPAYCMRNVGSLVGFAFGRWDIRFATGEKPAPELPDPFAPLPVCPPGMLQNEQGLPLTEDDVQRLQASGQWNYPLDIPWEGILVDDPGPDGTQPHRDDIVRRVREVLAVIWKDRAEAIEQEACEILEVKDLREYFRKPALFFADHLKRYSKSRRQAPIYWPLSTASGSYTLWIYYHRLNDGSLFTALNKYVKPKIDEVEKLVRQIESDLPGAAGRAASKLRDTFEDTKVFLEELCELRDELLSVASLPYKPNLNDGVLITAAPLWKLFRLPKWRKDLEECWKELSAGGYDWAHLAYSIWPDRVREVCKHDRSIAIAHGLEELCEVAVKPTKKKRAKKPKVEEAVLGEEE